jgi:hypothetical protein
MPYGTYSSGRYVPPNYYFGHAARQQKCRRNSETLVFLKMRSAERQPKCHALAERGRQDRVQQNRDQNKDVHPRLMPAELFTEKIGLGWAATLDAVRREDSPIRRNHFFSLP